MIKTGLSLILLLSVSFLPFSFTPSQAERHTRTETED